MMSLDQEAQESEELYLEEEDEEGEMGDDMTAGEFDLEKVEEGGALNCRFCNKSFSSRGLLNVHYTHTHRDKPQYDCEDCGLIFTVKRELATHRRIHSGSPLYTCIQCGKVFGTKQLLKKHHLWHTGLRSHVCPHPQCGKAFYQKGHLTQHLMIHSKNRPHLCHLCRKTFVFKFDLNRHLKIHAERGHMDLTNQNGGWDDIPEEFSDEQEKDRPSEDMIDSEFTPPKSSKHNFSSFPVFGQSAKSPAKDDLFQFLNTPSGESSESAKATSSTASISQQQPMLSSPNSGVFFGNGQAVSIADWLAFQAAYQATLSQHFLQQQHTTNGGMEFAGSVANGHAGEVENETIESSDSSSSQEKPSLENCADFLADAEKASVMFFGHADEGMKGELIGAGDCSHCSEKAANLRAANRRIAELEKQLEQRTTELDRLKQRTHRVGLLAGSLLETCSDFDKLWMLHSKKVYNSVQTILNTLE